ncbi:MAG: epoxyqueuosine reductase QueH [Candidatus Muiribacteriota bacterium]
MQLTNISELKGEYKQENIKILVHACCGVCFENFYDIFGSSTNLTVLWFNPNIHGIKEYRKRKEVLKKLVFKKGLKLIEDNTYSVSKFIQNTDDNNSSRCIQCYKWRLHKTAEYALKNGFKVFTTTLLCSPKQDSNFMQHYGNKVAAKNNLQFLFYDIRDCYDKNILKKRGFYTQNYCGCIFSEERRFAKNK